MSYGVKVRFKRQVIFRLTCLSMSGYNIIGEVVSICLSK